jgi:hypothetical protein
LDLYGGLGLVHPSQQDGKSVHCFSFLGSEVGTLQKGEKVYDFWSEFHKMFYFLPSPQQPRQKGSSQEMIESSA